MKHISLWALAIFLADSATLMADPLKPFSTDEDTGSTVAPTHPRGGNPLNWPNPGQAENTPPIGPAAFNPNYGGVGGGPLDAFRDYDTDE